MALAREQITIVDLHDGVDGSTYSLNILGGTRTISYNATGKSPTPAQTAYSCELYKDGVKVTPSSYAWSASGHLSGTSTDAGFTPTAVQTYNASLTSSNVVSLTVAYGGTVFKGTVQVVVTKAATDAKLITLVADSQVFKVVGKTVSPATAKITAETQNTSVTAWTYSANGAAFIGTLPAGVTRSGSTVTITGANMTAQTIAVKASDGTYSDVITIVKVADGGRGEPGEPAVQPITGFLTNESVTFPADFNGNVTGHTGPIGTFKVFQGTTDVTTSAAFTASNHVGGAISISDTGVYTLNSLTADRASVDLKAEYGGVSIVKTLTISKSRAGTPGPEGYTVILTNESHVFPGLESKAVPGSSVTSNIIVYKGPTQIESSVAVTGAPNGMDVTVAGKDSKSNRFTAAIHTTTPMTTMNGELTVTVTADGKTFPKKFSFAVAKKGTNGAPGSPARVVKIIPSALNFVTNTVSSNPASYVYTPSSIALTPTFQSCTYSKWQYSTNGSAWTNITTQNGLSINSTSKVLTVSSSSTLFSTAQTFLIFKCLSSTGEADVVTLNRVFESGALGSRLRTAEINLSEQEGKIALSATQEEVNAINTRLSKAEVKVEPGSIVSTVRGSTEYVDDLGEKVSTDEVISTINQRPGSVTIDASKIDINGAVTFSSFDKNLQDELNSKAKTFTSTPVPPYSLGDIWKNSTSTYMCKVARTTGSYVASDWEKTGDVTSANKAADTSKVGGTAAATVVTGATAGTAAKTRTDDWTYTGKTTINGGKIQADTITAAQIKADTITAREIAGNTITVNELVSNIGSSLDLSSNEAITSRVTSTQMSTALKGKADSIFIQDSTPAHKVGRLWLDTSTATNQLKRSDGTKWVVVSDVQVGGRNLIIESTLARGIYLIASGSSTASATWATTDFIPVTGGTPYIASGYTNLGSSPSTCFYNTSKVFISGVAGAARERVTTPSNAAFMRFSFQPQYLGTIKLEKGNIATDWTPAPEDIQAEMDTIAGEVGDVSGALSTLDGEVKGAFKDGIINEAEARAIEKYLNIVNTEKADVDAKYTKLYANGLLAGTAKSGLYSAKSSYNTAHTNLISAINTAIKDKLVNATEKANVDAKFASYKTALTNLSSAFETASGYLVNVVNNKIDMEGGILTRLNAAESKITPTEIKNTVSAIKNSEGKPYFAQTSEVKQTVDTWTAKFSSIGGANLLLNSKEFVDSLQSKVEHGGEVYSLYGYSWSFSFNIDLKKGETYTVSVPVFNPSGTASTNARITLGHIGNMFTALNPLETKIMKHTFTATQDENEAIVRFLTASGTIPVVGWGYPKLEKGSVATDWTPHPDELYTGVTRIDKDGVTVGIEGETIETNLGFDGVRVSDGATEIASFTGSGGNMKSLKAESISGDVVNTLSSSVTLNVGKTAGQFATVEQALASTGNAKYLGLDVVLTINIYDILNEDVSIAGFTGAGKVVVNLHGRINGHLWTEGNSCLLEIYGRTTGNVIKGTGYPYLSRGDSGVHLDNIVVDAMNSEHSAGFMIREGSTATLRGADIVNTQDGIVVRDGAIAQITYARGNPTRYGVYSHSGVAFIKGTVPASGSTAVIRAVGGFAYEDGTPSKENSRFKPPATTTTTETRTFNQTDIYTYSVKYGARSTHYGKAAAQNRWDTSMTQMKGRIVFGSSVYSFIAGRNSGTTPTVKIRLRRQNSSHGASTSVKPTPEWSGAPSFGGATRGNWTPWVTIPYTIFTSSGYTFSFFNGTTGNSYAIWDRAEVQITRTITQ